MCVIRSCLVLLCQTPSQECQRVSMTSPTGKVRGVCFGLFCFDHNYCKLTGCLFDMRALYPKYLLIQCLGYSVHWFWFMGGSVIRSILMFGNCHIFCVFSMHIGSQHQSWLLYFALPVLHGVLPRPYFVHLAKLVAALHILSSDNISLEKLHEADVLLGDVYQHFPRLYGMSFIITELHIHNIMELPTFY